MSAYLIVTGLIFLVSGLSTLRTTPGAPRKPEPSAATLMVVLLIQAGLAAWACFLLFGGAL